jgi:hypothetical protein
MPNAGITVFFADNHKKWLSDPKSHPNNFMDLLVYRLVDEKTNCLVLVSHNLLLSSPAVFLSVLINVNDCRR